MELITKFKLILILLVFPIIGLPYRGVIEVFEAPLFHSQDMTADVVQYLRKNQEIYISKEIDPDSSFYSTYDRNAVESFIPKKFVRLITNDENELKQNIKRNSQNIKSKIDPTDYRLKEPLPEQYPFYTEVNSKGGIEMGFADNSQKKFNYHIQPDADVADSQVGPTESEQSSNKTIHITYLKPSSFSKKIFIGGAFTFQFERTDMKYEDINLYNGFIVLERKSNDKIQIASIGPDINYILLKSENFEFTLGVNPNLAYKNATTVLKPSIKNSTNLYQDIESNYHGFIFHSLFYSRMQLYKINKNLALSFLFGIDYTPSHSLDGYLAKLSEVHGMKKTETFESSTKPWYLLGLQTVF